jgi:hypothetical protein
MWEKLLTCRGALPGRDNEELLATLPGIITGHDARLVHLGGGPHLALMAAERSDSLARLQQRAAGAKKD